MRQRLNRSVAVVALSALLLGGCVTVAVPTPEEKRAAAANLRQVQVQNWLAEGRAAVRDGDQAWQASVRWRQHHDVYSIDLIGPLGQGQARIEGSPGQVTLVTQDQRINAFDADELVARVLDVRLPVNGLRYWLRGLPNPTAEPPVRVAYSAASRQHLQRLEQSGWLIEYLNYQQVEGFWLPTRINARSLAGERELRIKLIVQTWTLNPPT